MKNHKSNFDLFVINKVKEKRIEHSLSQAELADILGVSSGFIGNVESTHTPSKYNLNHINKLAKIFRCSPKDFLPDTHIM